MTVRGGREPIHAPWLRGITVAYLVWSLLPLAYVFLYSFDDAITISRWEGFTLRWWSPWRRVSIFSDEGIAVGMRHTFLIALVAATVALLIGTTLALGIRHARRRTRFVIYALLLMAIAFPPIALGGALWIVFSVPLKSFPFGEFGWFGTRAQTLGLVALEVPFVALIVSVRLAYVSIEQEEMAADLGAQPGGVIRRVLLPQINAAIGAAALVAFTIGMGEFVITDALRSTDDTRSIASIFATRDPTPKVNALAVVLALAGFVASALVLATLHLGSRIRRS